MGSRNEIFLPKVWQIERFRNFEKLNNALIFLIAKSFSMTAKSVIVAAKSHSAINKSFSVSAKFTNRSCSDIDFILIATTYLLLAKSSSK